jgi:hypothetical protein
MSMRLLLGFLLSFGLNSLALAADPKPEKIASVTVTLDSSVEGKTAGIRTLFITVFDADSAGPMPYGSIKVDLKADPKGQVFSGDLDTSNITVMGQGRPLPKNIRLKARLDKDGSGGKDQAGDIVGTFDGPIVTGDKADKSKKADIKLATLVK